jgi:hypothetical protein
VGERQKGKGGLGRCGVLEIRKRKVMLDFGYYSLTFEIRPHVLPKWGKARSESHHKVDFER